MSGCIRAGLEERHVGAEAQPVLEPLLFYTLTLAALSDFPARGLNPLSQLRDLLDK